MPSAQELPPIVVRCDSKEKASLRTAFLSLIVLASQNASAQVERSVSVVGAIGAYSNPFASGMLLGVAGSGWLVLPRNIGASTEFGFIAGGGDAAVTMSVSGLFLLSGGHRADRTTAFVGGGYTHLFLLTDTGQSNAWNLNAGVDRRLGRGPQLGVEFVETFRHHSWTDYYSICRVGVTFGHRGP